MSDAPRDRRARGIRSAAFAAACAAIVLAAPASAEVRPYNLGDALIGDRSPFGLLPVRMQGFIAVPVGAGRHPVVLVVHGRHSTGCPLRDHESEGWPCPGAEQRNDRGLAHVLDALARKGIVAVAPGVNAAHTESWGEPDDLRRWPNIVNRTLLALETDAREGGTRFGGAELRGRLRMDRLGLLGHS